MNVGVRLNAMQFQWTTDANQFALYCHFLQTLLLFFSLCDLSHSLSLSTLLHRLYFNKLTCACNFFWFIACASKFTIFSLTFYSCSFILFLRLSFAISFEFSIKIWIPLEMVELLLKSSTNKHFYTQLIYSHNSTHFQCNIFIEILNECELKWDINIIKLK